MDRPIHARGAYYRALRSATMGQVVMVRRRIVCRHDADEIALRSVVAVRGGGVDE